MDFYTRFTREKIPQNNFSSQNFSVENNYFLHDVVENMGFDLSFSTSFRKKYYLYFRIRSQEEIFPNAHFFQTLFTAKVIKIAILKFKM